MIAKLNKNVIFYITLFKKVNTKSEKDIIVSNV